MPKSRKINSSLSRFSSILRDPPDAPMGIICSTGKAAESDESDKDVEDLNSQPSHSHALPALHPDMTLNTGDLRSLQRHRRKAPTHFRFPFQDEMAARTRASASTQEALAAQIVAHMRAEDEAIFNGQGLSSSQHFLHIRDLLPQTRLFQVAGMVPKGAHLHLHFNSTLLPGVLLGYAKDMTNMFIWSDCKLLNENDFKNCKIEFNLRDLDQVWGEMRQRATEFQDEPMLMQLKDAESTSEPAAQVRAYDTLGPNIFSSSHQQHEGQDRCEQEMRYQYFRDCWNEEAWGDCDTWLISKLTFSKEEGDAFFADADEHHIGFGAEFNAELEASPVNATPTNPEQSPVNDMNPAGFNEQVWKVETARNIATSNNKRSRNSARNAWDAFNGRTRMMKGLFNYETAFRRYTRECLEEFVKDNVQYAEIRPNFMQTNQILYNDAKSKIDNFGTMALIIEEYENFMIHIGDMSEDGTVIDGENHRPTFSGMKVIYCTPRSFNRNAVRKALDECIAMKKKWPQYIAGFDLVGEEAFEKPHPLQFFEEDFRNFRVQCLAENLDIPFLFHCGETPDDLEGNLETALRLGSKRIGHGYALPEKTDVLRDMKSQNICVETCPISNMVLGLAEHMDEHSVYRLLEEKMHCAVSSDNGTLFQSTLSHDFYEIMAGHRNINLYGWKQLAWWSIEHSCLSAEERIRTEREWERRWQDFIDALTETSTPGSQLATISQLEKVAEKVSASRLAKIQRPGREGHARKRVKL